MVQPVERLAPAGRRDIGERVDVHVSVAGMPEDRDGHAPPVRGRSNPGHVVAKSLQRHAAVLDHLQGAAGFRQPRQRGARQTAHLPEGFQARAVHRGGHVCRSVPQAAHRVPHHTPRRRLGLALELDDQQTLKASRQVGAARVLHKIEQGAVQQLHRRRVERDEVGHGLDELL